MLPGMTAAGLMAGAASASAGNPVTLTNKIVSQTNTDGSAATASFTFRTDRTVKNQANTNILTWLDATASPSSYQIRATLISGSTPSGASLNTWLGLSTNRQWTLTDAAGAAGSKTCKLTIEIRDAASPNTLRASATFTLKADSQSAGGGGSAVNWDDIFGTTTTIVGNASNADQTMDVAGTLNFAYSLDANVTVSVFKNGTSLGQVASASVSIGDLVHFRMSATSLPSFGSATGTITVSGAVSDLIAGEIDRTT